jgi:hypothetical protein
MAVINRYVQPTQWAAYNPMSLNELAFAPTFLRQRHDQAAQALSDLGIQSSQYDVLDQYGAVANQLVTPLQEQISSLSENLAKQGIQRSNAIPQAMKLKSEYANMFGAQGGIGQLQNRTAQYRQQAQAIDTFFKDAPELAQYMKARLNPGEAVLQDGRLQLGQIGTPTYVKDIPESEILKTLNTAAAGLKESDLGDFGLQGVVGVGDFDKIVTLASGKGVTAQRAMNLIQNLVGQDQWNSLYQRGSLMGLSPEQTQLQFLDKLKGIATSNATKNIDRDRIKITDEMALYRAKQEEDAIPFIADGSRINVDVINPFSGLVLSGNNISNEESQKQDQSYWKEKGFNVIADAGGGFKVFTKGGDNTNPIYDSKNSNSSTYNQRIEAFKKTKANNPELANLSDKEALEKINSYFTNLTQQYGKVEKISLNNPNFVEATLARGLNSSVFTAEGKQANLTDLLKESGYTDYNDYIAKNKNAYQGYRKFGPNGKIVHEFVLSDGSPFFIEGEDNIKNISQETSEFNQMIIGGNTVSNFGDAVIQTPDNKFVPVKEVKINPIATGSEPYSLKLVPKDSRVNLDNTLRSRLAGKTPKQAQEVLSSLGYSPTEYKIESLSEINRQENDLINSTLKYMRK